MDNALDLQWKRPKAINGYLVSYQIESTELPEEKSEILLFPEPPSEDLVEYKVTGLKSGTAYLLKVICFVLKEKTKLINFRLPAVGIHLPILPRRFYQKSTCPFQIHVVLLNDTR